MALYLSAYEVLVFVEAEDDDDAHAQAKALLPILRDAVRPAAPALDEADITLERVAEEELCG